MKKKVVRGRYATIRHSKYDFYRAAQVVGWTVAVGGLVLGSFLWQKADQNEKAAKHPSFVEASAPSASNHITYTMRTIKNLAF